MEQREIVGKCKVRNKHTIKENYESNGDFKYSLPCLCYILVVSLWFISTCVKLNVI